MKTWLGIQIVFVAPESYRDPPLSYATQVACPPHRTLFRGPIHLCFNPPPHMNSALCTHASCGSTFCADMAFPDKATVLSNGVI
jgi:hypothetical protein